MIRFALSENISHNLMEFANKASKFRYKLGEKIMTSQYC